MIAITSRNQFLNLQEEGKPMVLKVHASWCAPCRALAPTIDELEAENPELTFYSVDTEADASLTEHLMVKSIPLLLFFDGQKRMKGFSYGLKPKAELQNKLDIFKRTLNA